MRKIYVVIISSHEDVPDVRIAYTREEAETIAMAGQVKVYCLS